MTAKVLATLGALGIIATIWTADFRFLWTGLLLLIISIGMSGHREAQKKNHQNEATHSPERQADR